MPILCTLYIPKQCQTERCNPFIQKRENELQIDFVHFQRTYWTACFEPIGPIPFFEYSQTLSTKHFSLFWIFWIIACSICRALLLLSLNWTNVDVTSTNFITQEKEWGPDTLFALTEFGKLKIVIFSSDIRIFRVCSRCALIGDDIWKLKETWCLIYYSNMRPLFKQCFQFP